ncbi:ABC transporter ATP-binding protein [Cellulomonas fimi]|uniref:ABC transporter related protein n=1 Tax=Cellulomonas fimi (strain ATCC 484 / DSM 20113 / JCM 1341 / CCUG 24087 / LMG 16345 / NBRC 15513 / NCIMB 8980 / NCTC 7547 / NRS-133) TaxID=590998 RepID=F4H6G7_CELFA|nr:ABC transporter ATP-binding protein [Cellulomonas fimi]AEE45600.1 ABC transporter related protein [Cellulomonas fimi ATCC 484]VEH30017.1 Putative multidrug export ATP-binding/permease protein SAV1866 [Cellulomonas fimi]
MLRLLDWARPAVPRVVLGGCTALGASMLALAVPQVLRGIVNGPLLDASAGHTRGVVLGALLVLVLGVVEAVLVWSRRALILTPGTTVEREMRTSLFRHLLDLPVAFHDRWSGGQLLSRAMSDLGTIRRWMVFGLVMLLVSATTLVVGLVLMLATSWQLGLVYLVGAVPMVWLSFRFRTGYRDVARRARDQAGDLATTVEESVHGIRVLKAFGRGDDALDDFVRQADELRATEIHKARTLSRVSFALGALPEAVLAVSLAVGVTLTARGELSVGALVAFFATAAVVNQPVERLGALLAMTLDARAATDRYLQVVDTASTVTDPPAPRTLPPPGPRGARLELSGVRFAHGHGDDVLAGVDLVVEPGETVALVGLTGSGKTTLLQLVPRLYDVTGGSVRIDGVDVRDLTRQDLRRAVAVAFEDPILFSTSVRENVLLGVDPDDATDDRLTRALDVARADFVHRLPQGVDTVIGEEGLSLSGGQRQRVSLARAIAVRPRVLLLDDPLSALDVTTEAEVTRRLRAELTGTTTLVVAHRPSTVALADRVAVLEDGRITGVGTHTELLAHHPHYRFVLTALAASDEPWTDDEPVGTEAAR